MIGALLLLLPGASSQPQDVFQFRVDVRRVYVDVFVAQRGNSLGNLTARNFEVYDEGVLQEVELVDVASVPQTFALLLDESGSISGEKREHLQEAVRSFAERLSDDDELAVLSFSERTTLRKPLGFDRPEDAATYEITGRGWTGLNDALFLALSYLRTGNGRPILVAFTDGMDNASWIREETVLESARAGEAVVYSVRADVGAQLAQVGGSLTPGGSAVRSSAMLEELARMSGGRTVEAARLESIAKTFEEILSEVSSRYLLSFSPRADGEPGWHRLRVDVKGVRDVEVRARAGYFAPP
ncbi:MAG TPA: VWA domain-containing protein [Vicinamibacteria bacterium]|nr:VWA domain-containing protein [Vicinamibacteria bacterium]